MSSSTPIFIVVVTLGLLGGLRAATAAEAATPALSPARTEDTNSQETLRTYLQLQEQLHATQLAIEQSRKDADEAALRNAKELNGRLEAIESALAAQRSRELDAMQSSNRVMLIVAGTFAGVGFVAMLLMVYFQWRAVNRLAEISASLPLSRALANGPAVAALGPGDGPVVTTGPAERSNARLLGALERLEKRIAEMEHTARAPLKAAPTTADHNNGSSFANGDSAPSVPATVSGRLGELLAKGQFLLSAEKAEDALACFEEALALDPGQAEALVKKGAALERLSRLNEAIECYDQAIALDASLTIAYLHKGNLFNKMERFAEAIECYEQALQTQEKRVA